MANNFLNSKDATKGAIGNTWDPVTNDRIQGLDARLQGPVTNFVNDAANEGINLRVTTGYRSTEEQNRLYAIGRTTPGRRVTNVRGGNSAHNYGLAIDVVPIENGRANWNGPWTRIGEIGESHGFTWGGRWTDPVDRPHFQMHWPK